MKHVSRISGAPASASQFGSRVRRLAAVLTLSLLHTAHAEVLELEEFRYLQLMEHAEAAGYELDAERQINNAGRYDLLKTASDPSATNLHLDFNEDQYLLESLDSM